MVPTDSWIWTDCCRWCLGEVMAPPGLSMTYWVEVCHHGWPLKLLSASSSIPNDMPSRITCTLGAIEYHFLSCHWSEFGRALARIIGILYCPLLLYSVTTTARPTDTGYRERIFWRFISALLTFCFTYFESMLSNSPKLCFVMSFWIDLLPSIEKCFSLPVVMSPAWKSTLRAIPVHLGWMLV